MPVRSGAIFRKGDRGSKEVIGPGIMLIDRNLIKVGNG